MRYEMGLITPLDRFDSHGEEFPDLDLYTTSDLRYLLEQVQGALIERGEDYR